MVKVVFFEFGMWLLLSGRHFHSNFVPIWLDITELKIATLFFLLICLWYCTLPIFLGRMTLPCVYYSKLMLTIITGYYYYHDNEIFRTIITLSILLHITRFQLFISCISLRQHFYSNKLLDVFSAPPIVKRSILHQLVMDGSLWMVTVALLGILALLFQHIFLHYTWRQQKKVRKTNMRNIR